MAPTTDSSLTRPADSVGIEAKVALLSQPRNYCEATCPFNVAVIETHMAWVFLTDQYVYKLKKPVRYSFLDFSTVDARHEDCQKEVHLNRRLAEEVYLGIVAVRMDSQGDLHLNKEGMPVDWLVKMRRLPAERMLDEVIHTGTLTEQDVHRFMEKLTRFYLRAEPVPMTPVQYRQRFQQDIEATQRDLANPDYGLPAAQLTRINASQLSLLEKRAELLEQRAADQRIIEAHGDLRPEHICLTPEPMIIDCLEFNRAFRLLDPADELAFLAMECRREGADWISDLLFDSYGEATGDYPPAELIAFYKAYRATLRAKLAIWHLQDHDPMTQAKWIDRARSYLALAEHYLG